MIFKGKTNDEWHRENSRLVAKWEREDATAIYGILPKWRAEREWHPYFALFPVEVGDGETAWLETVERRLKYPKNPPTIMATWHTRSYEYKRFGRK
jgi:hypothetical protein